MAIDIDTTQPLRRPSDLLHLVEEVVKSGAADEASWLESKSDLDLTKHDGRLKIARAVLSFANRMPDVAERTCGGLAYVVVGAEAGNAAGTQEIDGADLENGLRPYLGTDGPVWSPTYVDVDGRKVLVVTVEAPNWGDRMHTLRKQGDTPKGTVFVRAQSNSRPADDAEIRMLEDRLLRGQTTPQLEDLQVGFELSGLDHLVVIDPSEEQIEEWIGKRRNAIKGWHGAVIASYAAPTSPFSSGPNRNLPGIDINAIEAHLQICRASLFDADRCYLIHKTISAIKMVVTSPGPRVLQDVELTLKINTAAYSAFDLNNPDELEELPKPPKPPKRPYPYDLALSLKSHFDIPRTYAYDPWINIEANWITLTIGTLRQEQPVFSSQFHLFLHERPPTRQLEIEWTLTSTSTAGRQQGSILVPVEHQSLVFLPPKAGISDEA